MLRYAWDLLLASLDGAGRIAMGIAVVVGVVVGLVVAGIVKITDQGMTNLGLWALIGGLAGFILYVLIIGPYQLVKRERAKRLTDGSPFLIMNFHDQVNVNYTFPGGRNLPSGSNTLFRAAFGEGLLVPPGTIPKEFTADAVIVDEPYEVIAPDEPDKD